MRGTRLNLLSAVVGLLVLPTHAGLGSPAVATGAPAVGAAGGSAAPGEERITAEGLRKQLMFLASPEFEGRESAERGGRAAARYLALEFARAGLKPVGPAHAALDAAAPSYYQPFKVYRHRWSADKTSLEVRRKGPAETVRTYLLGAEFSPDQFVGNAQATGTLVFAGYGITAAELGYDDYAGLDVRGKVVLAFDHEPQEARDDSRWGGRVHTRHAAIDLKARNAQKHGAVALLVMPEPLAEHKSFWDLWGDWYADNATLPRQALDEDDVSIPILYLRARVGRDLLAAAGREAAALQREIDASGRPRPLDLADLSVTVRVGLAEARVATTENIVGLVEGSDPKLKEEVVIVSAHHDHDGLVGGDIYAGADDDGSGTVCVLEMARALAAAERRPRRSVLFASWGAEEKGLLGSRFYTFRPLVPLERTAAILQLDMVGRDETPRDEEERLRFAGRDTRNMVNLLGTQHSPEFRALLGRLNEGLALDLDYKADLDVEEVFFTRSDHWPFALKDVPSLFFSTGLHPDYHTPADTPAKINYEKMGRIARLVYRSLWEIADAERRPAFTSIPVPPPSPAAPPLSPASPN
jgi:hypothetical protein